MRTTAILVAPPVLALAMGALLFVGSPSETHAKPTYEVLNKGGSCVSGSPRAIVEAVWGTGRTKHITARLRDADTDAQIAGQAFNPSGKDRAHRFTFEGFVMPSKGVYVQVHFFDKKQNGLAARDSNVICPDGPS